VGFLILCKENGAMHTALQTTSIKSHPKLLDQAWYTLRMRHCSCALKKTYAGWFGYSVRFHKTTHPQESWQTPETVNSESIIWKAFIPIHYGEGESGKRGRAAGGIWDKSKWLWMVRLKTGLEFNLEDWIAE
jgi:hypothetical protein